jgi:hypothetical protein
MKLRLISGTKEDPRVFAFYCEGCQEEHHVWVNGYSNEITSSTWQWNGSLDNPTFSPSLLIRSGHYAPEWKEGNRC